MNTLERVEGALAGLKSSRAASRDETPVLELAPADIHEACRRLRDAAGFETNTFVTAIDRFPAEPRFEVYWQFLSLSHNDRVRFMARVGERMQPSGTGGAGDAEQRSGLASVPSIIDLYPGAAFSERECYDMFGIVFDGHANLKRLLMPEDYGHFPLRKDFPHQGIEPDRLYREWDARRHRARVVPAPARESAP